MATDSPDTATKSRRRVPTRAASAYEAAKDRTYSAYEATRDRAAGVTRQAVDQIGVYPVAAVVGGIAVGALLGFLLPASRRETELLSGTGRKVTGAARDVAQRGVEMAKEQVEDIRGRAAQKVGEVVVEAVGGGKD